MNSSPTQTKTVRPLFFYVMMALAVVGIILSVILSSHYFEVRAGSASFKSLCNVNEKLNCDAVAASPYAEIFYGIPLSSFATGWFLAILAVSTFGLSAASRRMAGKTLFVMTGLGLLASLFYLYIMFSVLHTYCLYCLGVDVVTLLCFGVALAIRSSTAAASSNGGGVTWKTLALITAGCLFVSVVVSKGMDQTNFKRSDVLFMAQDVLGRAPLPVDLNDKFPSIGPKDAQITIVEYSDFQCPYCRLGAMELNTLLNRYPGKVRIIFRNYPLDSSCNRMMQHAGHPFACEAARGSYCSHQQGKFKEYYEETFENQTSLAQGKPAEFAKRVGVDPAKFEACMKSPETQAAISTDIEEGVRLGIQSTPTFFINGRKQDGGMPIPVWDAVLERLITR